jgi:hypothetical protein
MNALGFHVVDRLARAQADLKAGYPAHFDEDRCCGVALD